MSDRQTSFVDAMTAVQCSMCHGTDVVLASIKCANEKCGAVGNYQRVTVDVGRFGQIVRRAIVVVLEDRLTKRESIAVVLEKLAAEIRGE